jgi:Ca2+/H+ antiporter, TMEM165/GDT1 family
MQLDTDSPDGANELNLPDQGGFITGTWNSLMLILVTEIGDKTFFIAAVLAMRHGRLIVYLGCMVALGIMHFLSSVMGYALPALIPKLYTHYLSVLMFLYFGVRLLLDAREMGHGPSEELEEVEQELISKKDDGDSTGDVENGEDSNNKTPNKKHDQFNFSPEQMRVFSQAFTLTFLAEWGDRSQIATIALAASKNVYGVIVGGLIGHAFCTGLAVVGGRMLAARISEKSVAYVGGVLFLVFALHSFVHGPM